MEDTRLIFPCEEYKNELLAVLDEFRAAGETIIPSGLDYGKSEFTEILAATRRYAAGEDLPEGHVSSTTWWLIREPEQRILGAVNLRHRLNEFLLNGAGHIGYGVRPSERRRGYASRMLVLALGKCRELGLDRVLVVCNADNIGSEKTIRGNGGILEDVRVVDGKAKKRFWIAVSPDQ